MLIIRLISDTDKVSHYNVDLGKRTGLWDIVEIAKICFARLTSRVYRSTFVSIKGNRQVVNGLFFGGDSMEDQLTTNCKLFDRSFALHNRKCGGWDGCVRLKPMPLLPLPLLWAR